MQNKAYIHHARHGKTMKTSKTGQRAPAMTADTDTIRIAAHVPCPASPVFARRNRP